MDVRDTAMGRVRGLAATWHETQDKRDADRLRDVARNYLESGAILTDADLRRMVALLLLGRT